MVTVAELIKFLGQFPAETAVEIVYGRDSALGMDYSRRDLELPEKALNNADAMFEAHVEYYRPISGTPSILLGHAD